MKGTKIKIGKLTTEQTAWIAEVVAAGMLLTAWIVIVSESCEMLERLIERAKS